MEEKSKSCLVKFTINYETVFGEQVFVVGDMCELGAWKEGLCLKWTKGHNWVGQIELRKEEWAEYKYVIKGGKEPRWEKGVNRVLFTGNNETCEVGLIDTNQLMDVWEHYKVHFALNHKVMETQVMKINGSGKSLGNWNQEGPRPMRLEKSDGSIDLLPNLWAYVALFHTDERQIKYKYSIYTPSNGQCVWEREPTRQLTVSKLGKKLADTSLTTTVRSDLVTSEVAPINGVVNRLDVNFVANMEFQRIEPYKVFIGPYPQTEADIELMVDRGVTAVLNLQTVIDMNHRQVQWDVKQLYYKKMGVKAIHYPIHDFNHRNLVQRIRGAADVVKDLLEEGRSVYIHCTAGMGRAPSAFLVYLCLYKGVPLQEGLALVKKYRPIVNPNMVALNEAAQMKQVSSSF